MNSIQSKSIKTSTKDCYKIEKAVGATLAVVLLVQSVFIVSILIAQFI